MATSNSYLPAPTHEELIRQTAVGIAGSPVPLSRSVSTASDTSEIVHPDEAIRRRLSVYQTFLQHELDFLDTEIQELIQRPISQDSIQEAAFLELRNGLKIRYNNLRVKLSRVSDLLAVL
jgi:hypothetical protein